MELPGSQTDRGPIIRNSGNCSLIDLNLNPSGSTWPLNNLGMVRSGHHSDNRAVFLSSPNTQSAGDKEFIKHAMLEQEAEFRVQINELHRIYKRQVELMNERKEDEYKRKMQAQSLQANSVLSQDSIERALKQWGTPNNLPGLMHSQNHVAAPYSAQIMGSSIDSGYLAANFKCRKIGNIILDLQLPGEVYADFEEEKSSLKRNVSKQPANETYRGSTCESDLGKPCLEGAGLTSVSQQVSNSLPEKTPILFDLNAPFSLEDDIILKPSEVTEPVNQEIFVENREPEQVLVQLLESGISHESNPPLSDISTSKPEVPQQKPALVLTQRNSVHERPSGRIIVQALPCMRNCKKVGNRFIPAMAGLGSVKSVSECEDREKSGVVDLNSDYSDEQQQTANKPAVGLLLDLNSIASEEDEENESSPAAARMDSVENPAEKEEDLADLAGKAIVNISSSRLEKGIVTSEPIDIQPLHWFANIVSDNHEEDSVPEEMDYFEAMTLQIKETKQEDLLPNQKVEEPQPGPSQPTKVQRKSARRQRKNFQKEILPNLASLSICEAIKDLQTIGGLIEASNSGSSSKSASKRMWTRGRKQACLSSSSRPDNNVVSKEQASDSQKQKSVVDSQKQKSVVDWGNIKRRRRSIRCPVNKSPAN